MPISISPRPSFSLFGAATVIAVAVLPVALVGCGSDDDASELDLASNAVPEDRDPKDAEASEPVTDAPGSDGGVEEDGSTAQPDAGSSDVYAVGSTLRTTAALNLRTGPGTQHEVIVTMPAGTVVTLVTAAPNNGFYNVKYASLTGWASAEFLVAAPGATADSFPTQKIITPVPVRPHVQQFANVSCGTVGCPDVVSSYNGHSPSVDRALDVFQLRERGDRYSAFAVADKAHRVDYVIWRQRINSRDGRGWRQMEDRGSITANHYDHVHVSFDP